MLRSNPPDWSIDCKSRNTPRYPGYPEYDNLNWPANMLIEPSHSRRSTHPYRITILYCSLRPSKLDGPLRKSPSALRYPHSASSSIASGWWHTVSSILANSPFWMTAAAQSQSALQTLRLFVAWTRSNLWQPGIPSKIHLGGTHPMLHASHNFGARSWVAELRAREAPGDHTSHPSGTSEREHRSPNRISDRDYHCDRLYSLLYWRIRAICTKETGLRLIGLSFHLVTAIHCQIQQKIQISVRAEEMRIYSRLPNAL